MYNISTCYLCVLWSEFVQSHLSNWENVEVTTRNWNYNVSVEPCTLVSVQHPVFSNCSKSKTILYLNAVHLQFLLCGRVKTGPYSGEKLQ